MSVQTLKQFRIPIRQSVIEGLSTLEYSDIEFHELAAFALIVSIDGDPDRVTASNAEHHYARFVSKLLELEPREWKMLFESRVKDLSPDKCRSCLSHAGIVLMTAEEFEARHYKTPTGEWVDQSQQVPRFDVKQNRFLKPKSETVRQSESVSLRIKKMPDEPLKVSGVAGCGKTHQVKEAIESLSSCDLIVLTSKPSQFAGLEHDVEALSPVQLCDAFVKGLLGDSYDARRKQRVPFDRLADYFSVGELHGWDKATVMSYILEMVDNFCRSPDLSLNLAHLPAALPDDWTRSASYFLDSANAVWSNIARARYDSKLPVSDLHAIKIAQLNHFSISCSHLLIDEYHDLTPCITEIVQRNSEKNVVMAFGDSRQITDIHPRLGGFSAYPVDQLDVNQSIRSGFGVASLVKASMAEVEEGRREVTGFYGNDAQKTEIIQYDYSVGADLFIPDEYVLMVSGSPWWLLVATIRLISLRRPFFIMENTRRELNDVLDLALSFRSGNLSLRRNPLFMGCSSWDDLVERRNFGVAGLIEFERILVKSGLDLERWKKNVDGCAFAFKRNVGGYILATPEECKGHEVDRSMILPDLANLVGVLDNKKLESHSIIMNKLYVSLTRAKRRIYLPARSRIMESV